MAFKYTGPTKLLINNEWVDSVSKKTFPTLNPATGEVIANIAEADKADVDIAVKVARRAFQSWRNVAPGQRCKLLWKLADEIEKHGDELAAIDSHDNGKPISHAKIDVQLTIECLRYYAGWADKLQGKHIPVNGESFVVTVHEPIGVVGAITPWNFPLLMFAWKIGPCLATGNVLIIKPAEQTPLSALRTAELAVAVGYPAGVLQILPGYGPTAGAALSQHMDVDKLALTGSTEVGRIIQRASADSNLKKVTLELGGKSPLIIMNDADLNEAAEIAHFGLFFNQGECCCASSRIYCHEKVYDEFVKLSIEKAKKRIVGNPNDPNTEQGAQVDQEQYDKIMGYIESGKKEGAQLACGGKRVGDKGFFIEPTVFVDVKDDMKIAQEEIFGPVMSILKFSDINDVIKRANKTNYGLAAGICTKSVETALSLSQQLRAGTVWVNCYDAFSAAAPFGGYKQSGIGRELGEYGLRQYCEVKTICIKVPRHNQPIEFC